MLTTAAASKTFTSTSGHSTVVEASSNWISVQNAFCQRKRVREDYHGFHA